MSDLANEYFNNYFQKISKIEDSLHSEMAQITSLYHLMSMLTPPPALSVTTEEVGSAGMRNLLDFYRYTMEKKKQFLLFFIDKVWIKGFTGPCKVESFIKGSENIYQGKSYLPHYFILGLILTLIYTAILSFLASRKFKQRLYHVPKEEINQLNPDPIHLEKGTVNPYITYSPFFKDIVYNLLSAQYDEMDPLPEHWKITIDQQNFRELKERSSFIYIGNRESLPSDIIAGEYLKNMAASLHLPPRKINTLQLKYLKPKDLRKTIGELQDFQRDELLIAPLFLKEFEICLLFNTARNFFQPILVSLMDRLDELALKGLVIYVATQNSPEPLSDVVQKMVFRMNNWHGYINLYQQLYLIHSAPSNR
ncbi:MAG: hypothetical protein ACM3SY_16920 [Candidatus Omnitrophota bacterium]